MLSVMLMCGQMTITVTEFSGVIILAINTFKMFVIFTAGANHY
jgi:hypothetical protein